MKARPAKAPPVPAHPGLTVLEDEVVWDGRFPLQRVRFRYTRFDGAPSSELTWELWRRGSGCAVLPYDPVRDSVALIEQFRLPALAAGRCRPRPPGGCWARRSTGRPGPAERWPRKRASAPSGWSASAASC